ncbi:MAG: MerR family transcriptional regulator [Candidatus Aminicenantes bacterium]|nr:MAG: MerR family transcriptional regulator [Candidatus Aminicenantes bacterium]
MDIPDKLTFKRTEVIKLTKLDGKVIDYWQKEFGRFAPTVNQTGEQFYTKKDVELILKIKQWLIVEKIEKSKIKEMLNREPDIPGVNSEKINNNRDFGAEIQNIPLDKLKIIKHHLQEILTILDKNDKR